MIPYTYRPNVQRYLHLRYDIISSLFRLRPNIVVSGEMGIRSLQAAIYCRLTGTPLVIWCEGTAHTDVVTFPLKLWLRRYLVRRASRIWTNGKETTAHLQAYGADLAKIDPGMTGADTMRLSSEVGKVLSKRNQIRSELGLDGTVLLFNGRIV